MNTTYDRHDAQKLVPLLDAIFREVADRRHEIRLLEKQLVRAKRESAADEVLLTLRARLASHRRELRLARKEFERLGCQVDDHNPNRVLIAGPRGERSFRWDAGDESVHRLVSDAPAS